MQEIRLPKRVTKQSALLGEWLVDLGQKVQKKQPLAVVETADAVVTLESPAEGTIHALSVQPGMLIPFEQPICSIGPEHSTEAPTPKKEPANQSEDLGTAMTSSKNTTQGQVTPILMPQAGQSMEEGTILEWKVKEGDDIEVGQVIFEIETDKANMDVEAPDAGRLAKIVAHQGDIIECMVPVAYIAEQDSDVEAYLATEGGSSEAVEAQETTAPASQAAVQTQKSAASTTETGRVKASPAARKLASSMGVDVNAIAQGSGPDGRILSTDVKTATPAPKLSSGGELSKMRRAIARSLLFSKQNIPHFYAKMVVDSQKLFETYREVKATQFKCTINDFITAACARAVREFEPFRSQFQADETIRVLPDVNMGVAVGTDEGLTVPVVLRADTLSLQELAQKNREVVEGARQGKMANVGQGVFTISNMGMFGVEDFQAIINPPESAILAVGALREAVKVENAAMRATRLMSLTLSVDHRVIDGAVAAQFLVRVRELLEAPEQLV
jgi:pyruvate dehydrogenase E2 component (dihydrolipoamide acetyltransferase)